MSAKIAALLVAAMAAVVAVPLLASASPPTCPPGQVGHPPVCTPCPAGVPSPPCEDPGCPTPSSACAQMGCFYYGWMAGGIPVSTTTVDFVMSYHGLQPSPISGYPCAPPAAITHPDWSSWSDSCLGVPAGTSVRGAWCGAAFPGGFMTCTNTGSGPFVVGIDQNGDGLVNRADTGGILAPAISEIFGAGTGTAPTGVQPPWPKGRIIVYPVGFAGGWGASSNADVSVHCA